jgi:hypothetical protein
MAGIDRQQNPHGNPHTEKAQLGFLESPQKQAVTPDRISFHEIMTDAPSYLASGKESVATKAHADRIAASEKDPKDLHITPLDYGTFAKNQMAINVKTPEFDQMMRDVGKDRPLANDAPPLNVDAPAKNLSFSDHSVDFDGLKRSA